MLAKRGAIVSYEARRLDINWLGSYFANGISRDRPGVADKWYFAAIDDFMRPDRVVVGLENKRATEVMAEIYRPLYLRDFPILTPGHTRD